MSTGNTIGAMASAVATRLSGRAGRATAFIRRRKEDVSLKTLEATRVFVSAVFRDITPAKASSLWFEPFLITPIVPTSIPKMKVNEVGMRVADSDEDPTNARDAYMIYPGRLVDPVHGNRVVHIEGLIGLGSEWGSFDLIDELNEILFPEELLPETGPNWLHPRDPRHRNLFNNIKAHVTKVANGFGPNAPERAAAQGVLDAIVLGQDWYGTIFDELAKQANTEGKQIPFGPTEQMWLDHLNKPMPNYAVRYDATAETEVSPLERAVERLLTAQAEARPQTTDAIPPAVLERFEALAAENAELKRLILAGNFGATEVPATPAAEAPQTAEAPAPPADPPAPAVTPRRR